MGQEEPGTVRLEDIRRADVIWLKLSNYQHCSAWEIPGPQSSSGEVKDFGTAKLLLEMFLVFLNGSK